MGEIVKISCRVCQREWEHRTGCGLQHGRKESVIAAFQERERAEVSDWLSQSQIPLYDFRYQIVCCASCGNLVSVPVLRGIDESDIFAGGCPVCGERTKMPLPESISDIVCPVCGKRELAAEEIGHWD